MEPLVDEGVPQEVARQLQDHLDAINAESPASHHVPPFLANFRHPCTRARQSKGLAGKGVSTAIDLKEKYVTTADLDIGNGEYAIIYREGSCKKCGQTARSEAGRVVETAKRPPITGRVGRA